MAGGFEARKATGALAETLLRELLTDSGAIVTAHQQNHDATRERGAAAVAHAGDDREHHIPDLEAWWPGRGPQSRCFIEAKAKKPLDLGGGWGLDTLAFQRALRWMEVSGVPVFYAIRNTAEAPLLPARRDAALRDDPELWCVAGLWKLARSDNRGSFGAYCTWRASDFMPLRVLLDGAFEVLPVPYFPRDLVGDPPVPRLF